MATIITTGLTETSTFDFTTFYDIPLRADDASVNQFCTEHRYTLSSYTQDQGRFSNDGARLYNCYVQTTTGSTYGWKDEYGYAPVVTSITIA